MLKKLKQVEIRYISESVKSKYSDLVFRASLASGIYLYAAVISYL